MYEQLFTPPTAPLHVYMEDEPDFFEQHEFQRDCRIGRGKDCEICLNIKYVSRIHVEGIFENGHWIVRDLNSINGMFVSGDHSGSVTIVTSAKIRLGVGGPFVPFTVMKTTHDMALATMLIAPPSPVSNVRHAPIQDQRPFHVFFRWRFRNTSRGINRRSRRRQAVLPGMTEETTGGGQPSTRRGRIKC